MMTNGFNQARKWKPNPRWCDGLQYRTFKVLGPATRGEKFFYAMRQAALARANRHWVLALNWLDTARDYQDYGRVLCK